MVQTLWELTVSLLWESQCVMKEIEISQVRDIPSSRKLGMLTLQHRAFCISGTSCHLVHTLQYLFIPGLPWLMKIQMNNASKFKSKGQICSQWINLRYLCLLLENSYHQVKEAKATKPNLQTSLWWGKEVTEHPAMQNCFFYHHGFWSHTVLEGPLVFQSATNNLLSFQ